MTELIKGFIDGLRPTPRLTVSEWADANRILSTQEGSEPGPWRTDRAPYLREIMDSLSVHDPCQEIVVMKGAQLGFTQVGYNFIGYIIDLAPGPIMQVMPTEGMAKTNSKTKFEPMIETTPAIREKIAPAKSRDSSNSMLQKQFPGGFIIMAGANAPTQLRSASIRYLILDETDGYPLDAGEEGSPIELAEARTRTFADKKVYKLSTPTIEGISVIAAEFEKTDKRYCFVPCPHCGSLQTLRWERIRYEVEEKIVVPGSTYYECQDCAGRIEERHKLAMLRNHEWIATAPERTNPLRKGFHINSLYSTFAGYSWEYIAQKYVDAEGNPEKLKAFTNTILAETWKEPGEAPEWEALYERREDYERNVPSDEVAVITVGADVQADRIELEVVGWMRDLRTMSLDYRVLIGDTSQPEVWDQLARVVFETWKRPDGAELPMSRMAVDSGYNTTAVYNFCRRFDTTRVIAVKGFDKQPSIIAAPKQVDVNAAGKRIGTLRVWQVGVSVVKSEVYSFLRQRRNPEEPGDPFGFCRFPEYGVEYFKGITGEEKRFKIVRGVRVPEWHKTYERNEPLDCRVYARAAAAAVGIDHWRPEDFDAAVAAYQPKTEKRTQKRSTDGDFWGGYD